MLSTQRQFHAAYQEHVILQDGTRLRIRPIRAGDKAKFAQAFRALSPQSRYRRCFSLKRELSAAELSYFCAVDGVDHFALVVVLLDSTAQEQAGIGGARFIRLGKQSEIAEIAFLMVDAWQRRGIAQRLLQRLVEAALERGICKLRCYLLADNSEAHQLLRKMSDKRCWDISFHREGGLIAAELSVAETDPSVDLLHLAACGYCVAPAALTLVASDAWWQLLRTHLVLWANVDADVPLLPGHEQQHNTKKKILSRTG